MTVKFHLKTELPDSFVPHRSHPHHHYQYEYQPPHQHADTSDVFYLKKEPSHSYSSVTPCSSPSPSPATASLQPEFVDWLHPQGPPVTSQPANLTTLTNYIPFTPDFNPHHSHSVSDNSQPSHPPASDLDSLSRVRRTILATPQPM